MPDSLGPYRIEKLLGRGGMGAVYSGVHQETDERVAIKVLTSGLAGDEHFRDRFSTEIETLKKLRHPYIVRLFGYGEQDGCLFYTMELVEGRSLQDELGAARRFQWREVARIGVEICAALKHAHDRGVIHRDLKPANLLLTTDDHVRLLDFGIAKLFGATQMTAAGGVLGTADYMAPEQAAGRPVTVRTDLYGLGSVLYALLAGRPPFHGKTLPEVIHSLRYDTPRPIRKLVPEVPMEFEQIISQLLEKEPDDRIATALLVSKRLKAMEFALSIETSFGELPDGDDEPSKTKHGKIKHGKIKDGKTKDGKTKDGKTKDGKTKDGKTKDGKTGDSAGAESPAADADPDEEAASDTKMSLPDDPNEAVKATRMSTSVRPTTEMGASVDDAGEYQLQDSGEQATLASAPGQNRSSTTTEPPLDRPTHYTAVDAQQLEREERRRETGDDDGPWWFKPLIASLMVIVVIVMITAIWFASRPSSADQLYAQFEATAGEPDQLSPLQAELEQFVQLYSKDERIEQVNEWLRDVDSYRFQRKLERNARRIGGLNYLPPIEQMFLEAMRNKRNDRDAARRQLELIVQAFGDDPKLKADEKRCIELARHEARRIVAPSGPRPNDNGARLNELIQRAEQRMSPDLRNAYRRKIVALYGDKPWAAEAVQRCRDALGEP